MSISSKQYAELLARNPKLDPAARESSCAKPEPAICHEPVAAPQGEASHPGRISVRITSFRRRLLDPDNLCAKYFIDCLRFAGLIPNDRQEDIELQVSQIKVQRGEHTEITIAKSFI